VRVRDPIFPLVSKDRDVLEREQGEKMRIEVPVVAGGKPVRYTFVFRIDRVQIMKDQNPDDTPEGIVGACPCKKSYRSDEP
jgi:hypothetical protein